MAFGRRETAKVGEKSGSSEWCESEETECSLQGLSDGGGSRRYLPKNSALFGHVIIIPWVDEL